MTVTYIVTHGPGNFLSSAVRRSEVGHYVLGFIFTVLSEMCKTLHYVKVLEVAEAVTCFMLNGQSHVKCVLVKRNAIQVPNHLTCGVLFEIHGNPKYWPKRRVEKRFPAGFSVSGFFHTNNSLRSPNIL